MDITNHKAARRFDWQQMDEIYHAALSVDVSRRHVFVADRSAGDVALRDEVLSLLESDELAADFLKEPVVELSLSALANESLRETEIVSQPNLLATPDLTGQLLGSRYKVIKKLRGGGFGDVFKATDSKVMSRPVIIKVLKDEVFQEENAKRDWLITKFRQEIEALSKIDDPRVVRILDADSLPDGRPYIVMEFVEGSDLRRFIKDAQAEPSTVSGLPFQDVAEIVKQVGRTLTAAHEAGVFHRDLKPENIMVRRNNSGDLQVKVIDFGIAKVKNSVVAPSTATGLFAAGTWQYMSPEQLHMKKVDAGCDIYALGVIAYEILTGRYPFPARNPTELKEMQEAGLKIRPSDLNPEISASAQDAIVKALEFYPAERHQRTRDLGDELANALNSHQKLVRTIPAVNIQLEAKTLENLGHKAEAGENLHGHSASLLNPHRRLFYGVSIAILATAIGLGVWQSFKSRNSGSAPQLPVSASQERTLTCWLSVLRPQDKEPWKSMGNIAYGAGTKLWFNVQTTEDGALYLLAEGREGERLSEINTLYPTNVSGNGDARLAAGTVRRLNENPLGFRNGGGVIDLWIIWADKPIQKLDEIVKSSYLAQLKIVDPVQQAAWRDFKQQYSSHKTVVVEDGANRQLTLKGQSNVLVAMRRMEYQP